MGTGRAGEPRILPAIRRLYEAATDAGRWPAFLEELARAFDADGSHIVRVQPRERTLTFSALYGYDEPILSIYGQDGADLGTALARYEQHFTQLMPTDPRVRFIERFPGRPLSCRLQISEAELHASQSYQEVLQRADVEYSLVVSLPEDDGSLIMLGVFRGKRSRFFNQTEVDAFGELIPHVKQAVALSEHLARVDFANRIALEALDGLAMGVLIVDESARVLHANAAAERIVRPGDGIAVQNGTVKLRTKEDDARLRRAVWDAVAGARAGAIRPSEAVAVSRPSGGEPYPMLVGTLWGNHLRYGLGRLDRPLAVLFLSNPEEPHETPAELLRRLFGLTLAEARVCELLVRGRTVDEAAEDLGNSDRTVRVHLRSVFGKTGVSRQAELIAKILASPVWLLHQRRGGRGIA